MYGIRPIGTVVKNKIILEKKWASALKGIEGFSHIIVICWLDRAKAPKMQIRPKGLTHLPKIGFLATRTRHRANPIAMTVVKLIRRDGRILRVEGLDVWDHTPVIDLKPYTGRESIPKFKIPAWVKLWDKAEPDPLRRYSDKARRAVRALLRESFARLHIIA